MVFQRVLMSTSILYIATFSIVTSDLSLLHPMHKVDGVTVLSNVVDKTVVISLLQVLKKNYKSLRDTVKERQVKFIIYNLHCIIFHYIISTL
jgi:hypothetical protein